ncbi:hypothetical protein AVEN_155317-1, partial [Araneus ventricosus]
LLRSSYGLSESHPPLTSNNWFSPLPHFRQMNPALSIHVFFRPDTVIQTKSRFAKPVNEFLPSDVSYLKMVKHVMSFRLEAEIKNLEITNRHFCTGNWIPPSPKKLSNPAEQRPKLCHRLTPMLPNLDPMAKFPELRDGHLHGLG